MAHKGHPKCEFRSKAECERAQREKRGRCAAMVQGKGDPRQCTNWAVDSGWCGTHLTAELERQRRERVARDRATRLQEQVNTYLAWTAEHPSVWDRMPPGWCPPSVGSLAQEKYDAKVSTDV